MKKRVLIAIFFASALSVSAQFKGVVFEDNNKNGVFDRGEKPLSGVIVTDGETSVKSDVNGVYELPTRDSVKFVTVSTPNGYTYVGNFYHRVESAKNFDFGLKRVVNEPNKFIHISDNETYVYKSWIDNLKDYVATNPTSFIALTGDICYEKGLAFHGLNFTSEDMGTRVVTTLGNHDLVGENHSGEKLFEEMFGPVWYSFNVGGVHFVVTPMAGGDRYPGYTTDELIEWLKGDLAMVGKDTPLVFFNHDLVFQSGEYKYKTKTSEFDLGDYNLKGWFYGHWHVNLFKEMGGVKTYGTSAPDKGGIDYSPACFRVVDFDNKGEMQSELRYSGVDKNVVSNVTKSGNIAANIYSSGAYVASATVKSGKNSYPLTQKSDWAWAGVVPKGGDLILETKFNDGSFVKSQIGTQKSVQSPTLEWAANYLGANTYMSAPIVSGDVVIYATIDDNASSKCGLTAVSRINGELLWSFMSENSIKNNFVSDGRSVFACDLTGVLYKLDINSGKLLGKMNLHDYILPTNNLGMAINGSVVYAGHGSSLSAVDTESFKKIWTTDAKVGGEGTNLTMTVANGVLFSGGYWRGRYAFDKKTGALLWNVSQNGASFCASSAAPYKDLVYYVTPEYIIEADAKSGEMLRTAKSLESLGSTSAPLVTDDLIILGTSGEGVVAYSRKTLKQVWNFKTRPALVYTVAYTQDYEKTVESSPVLKDGVLYFGGSDGYLYAIDSANGTFKWNYNIGSPILSKVELDNKGNLFVNDFGGTLYKFNL